MFKLIKVWTEYSYNIYIKIQRTCINISIYCCS